MGKKGLLIRLENSLDRISGHIIRGIQWAYRPMIKGALKAKTTVILLAAGLFALALFTFSRMGGEFITQLDEGDIAMQALIRPGSGLKEAIDVSTKIENILLEHFPEIKTVLARIGVAVLNGLVLISRFNSLRAEGVTNLRERILIGAQERLRPILLTATAAIMGFTPMAFSTSPGAEVQRPWRRSSSAG